jgi:HD-like signal output (HDOD) protein
VPLSPIKYEWREKMVVIENLLESKRISLPPLPEVAARLKEEMEKNPDQIDFNKIVNLAEIDPTLSGRIMEIANSSFYARNDRKVNSILAALNRMGLESFYNEVLTSLISEILPHNKKQEFRRFWKHSVLVASMCRVVTKLMPESNRKYFQERAYMAGLFHDIGMLYVSEIIAPKTYNEFEKSLGAYEGITEIEEDLYGVSHNFVGATVAKKWHLPDEVLAAIILHHHTEKKDLGNSVVSKLKAILVLSEILISENMRMNKMVGGMAIPAWTLTELSLTQDHIGKYREMIAADVGGK